tara:strand:+ start:162 stop:425 length:264 start_codon:yes stop_codon:yes gene_type:complete
MIDMEYEQYATAGILLIGAAFLAWKKIKTVMKDGEVTLAELIDIIEDLPNITALKQMKKAEIQALCEERGITTEGTKAQLIDLLRGA